MPFIPQQVDSKDEIARLSAAGLTVKKQGKVREIYTLPERTGLAMVASDRLSVFDIVMPRLVPMKGPSLTATTVKWTEILNVHNHVIAYGVGIDPYLPKELRGDPDLQARMLIVEELDMVDVECVVRGYLTGSAWKEYRQYGTVNGIRMPDDLHDGSKLPEPIFHPTTKATEGHDIAMSVDEFRRRFGDEPMDLSIKAYLCAQEYAESRGIIIADTKEEWGRNARDILCLGDEIFTPDSSRIWLMTEWETANRNGQAPGGLDKEPTRRQLGGRPTPFKDGQDQTLPLSQLDPGNKEHMDWVAAKLEIPDSVISQTTKRYLLADEAICGCPLAQYQWETMGIGKN